ncbi:hypothetical protein WOC76_06880 [Methylocystis sp. IM3]|jgi:hypothetical protein|uniref:hypothetical protein n=1 Tax=unclassified Methylocystis TaxID=2625913 RepID=UPI000FB30BB9|nr:MAG: hypothetical protein EKK29_13695 [Hyphomicrobiales bacterium]
MNPLTQLDQLRRQMAEELTQIPQYRALKATERFIADLSSIYEGPSDTLAIKTDEPNRKIAQAIENHLKGESSPASIVKNGSYLPVHRVA